MGSIVFDESDQPMDTHHNTALAHDVLRHFAQFIGGDLSVAAFEQWVYSAPDIADVIGYDNYFELLAVEYRLAIAAHDLQYLVTQLADQYFPGELFREQVRIVLCGLVTGTLNVFDACDRLTWWHNQGAEWIPILFVGIESELDAAPHPGFYGQWEPQALAARLAEVEPWVAHYRELAQAEARQLLAAEFADRPCR